MKYIKPPLRTLRRLIDKETQSKDIALDVYCSPNFLLREFFWARLWLLTVLIRRFSREACRDCLDFGGGSGIFMVSLATGFDRVHLIDLNTEQAEQLKRELEIDNVAITAADIGAFEFEAGIFDAIVAADVLEHFQDLDLPIKKIHGWLGAKGYLYTSLPSENLFYRLLRVVFRKQKPEDHYHTAREVEAYLGASGFRKIFGLYHPLIVPILPLFRISVWQKV
jgi:2-polyprenyl-3-methyl-5-hydroxy-6-metoxy-1,4-benzoquinol methylase